MSTKIIATQSIAEIAQIVHRVTRHVTVYCPQPGDAASPVVRIAGPYSRQIGQSADWRHHTQDAVGENEVYVEGYWDNDEERWIAIVPDEAVEAVCREAKTITVVEDSNRKMAKAVRLRESIEEWEQTKPEREAAELARQQRISARRAELADVIAAARGKIRKTVNGSQHGGDGHTLAWAIAKATGESSGYAYDIAHGERMLRVFAENGFAD